MNDVLINSNDPNKQYLRGPNERVILQGILKDPKHDPRQRGVNVLFHHLKFGSITDKDNNVLNKHSSFLVYPLVAIVGVSFLPFKIPSPLRFFLGMAAGLFTFSIFFRRSVNASLRALSALDTPLGRDLRTALNKEELYFDELDDDTSSHEYVQSRGYRPDTNKIGRDYKQSRSYQPGTDKIWGEHIHSYEPGSNTIGQNYEQSRSYEPSYEEEESRSYKPGASRIENNDNFGSDDYESNFQPDNEANYADNLMDITDHGEFTEDDGGNAITKDIRSRYMR